MSTRRRALVIAAAVLAPLFIGAAPAHATCIPGHVTVYPKPSVQLPQCDQPPQ